MTDGLLTNYLPRIFYLLVRKYRNACALEFACILGRNIKCSVIIIIITYVTYVSRSGGWAMCADHNIACCVSLYFNT